MTKAAARKTWPKATADNREKLRLGYEELRRIGYTHDEAVKKAWVCVSIPVPRD